MIVVQDTKLGGSLYHKGKEPGHFSFTFISCDMQNIEKEVNQELAWLKAQVPG